jgi:ParB/RepB/Spo0J family partition protein
MTEKRIIELRPEQLVDCKYQPRINAPSRKDVEDLMLSIERAGQQQPITVMPVGDREETETYSCLFGRRRWFAIHYLNEKREEADKLKILAIVETNLDEKQARRTAVVENLHRKDLSAFELAAAIRDYAECAACSFEEAANEFGVQRRTAFRLQAIFNASEYLLTVIREKEISAKPADLLVKLEAKSARRAKAMALRIANGEATSADIEKAIQSMQHTGRGSYVAASRDVDLQTDENKLSLRLSLTREEKNTEQVARVCKALAAVLRHLEVPSLKATFGNDEAA